MINLSDNVLQEKLVIYVHINGRLLQITVIFSKEILNLMQHNCNDEHNFLPFCKRYLNKACTIDTVH